MLGENEIKDILRSYRIEKSIPRKLYVNEICKYIDRKEIIILKGVRRSGKTTILKQLIEKIGRSKCIYVNLDDYRFLGHLSVELLEKILQTRKGESYVFLDEIQNIPGFESWLRTHYDMGSNVKFIVSGSNSRLMTKEFGALLTGRSLTFEIKPLSYPEFCDFSGGDVDEFVNYGGFPEVVLEKDVERKKQLLLNYFDTIVEKDLILKYGLGQQKQLKELLKFIILNPGIRISANKLSKQLGVSVNTVRSYLNLAEEVYLIFEVPFFSYSAKTKFIGARVSKYYVVDNGFYHLFATRFEKSKLYENAVALHFFRKREDLYYWVGKNEVDFVIEDKAINVVSSKRIPEREFLGPEELNKNKIIVAPFTDKSRNIVSFEDFLSN